MNWEQGRLAEFAAYHFVSYDIGDIDPSYPMLIYVADRFELNMEQRYWLAFLYAATYCGAAAYYIYNEFPDYENVNVDRLRRWWKVHKNETVFQTDRLWIRSRDQFVPMFESYRYHVGEDTQKVAFERMLADSEESTYGNAYAYFINVKYFGRFSMFLWLEAVHVVTGFPMQPVGIDWRHAKSSRNGLAYAVGKDYYLRGHDYGDESLSSEIYDELDEDYSNLLAAMKSIRPDARVDAWNVETTLCAYKKWHRGKRYPGYYLDRQYAETVKMQDNVTDGVDWSILWDFRREMFEHGYLQEFGNVDVAQHTAELVEEYKYLILEEC